MAVKYGWKFWTKNCPWWRLRWNGTDLYSLVMSALHADAGLLDANAISAPADQPRRMQQCVGVRGVTSFRASFRCGSTWWQMRCRRAKSLIWYRRAIQRRSYQSENKMLIFFYFSRSCENSQEKNYPFILYYHQNRHILYGLIILLYYIVLFITLLIIKSR